METKTPEGCQRKCDKDLKCFGFTWVDRDSKQCNLKPEADNKPLPVPSYTDNSAGAVISGYKNCGKQNNYYTVTMTQNNKFFVNDFI